MYRTSVKNNGDAIFTFPAPYTGVLGPGNIAVLSDDTETVIANLGGAKAITNILSVTEEPEGSPVTTHDTRVPSGGGIPTPPPTAGLVPLTGAGGVVGWTALTMDDVAAAFAPSVALASPAAVEVGATVTNPAFTCGYNRAPAGPCAIDDGAGGSVSLVTPFTSGTLVKAYTKTTPNDSQGFTLTANGPPSKTATCTKRWQPRRYFGVAPVPGAYDEAFIEGLASSDLGASRAKAGIAFNAGASDKCYYAFPTSYGGTADNFIDAGTGWPAGMSKVATGVSVTNAYGVVITYDVWESDQVNLGVWSMNVT